MTIHILKTDGDCWDDVREGRKTFEIRKDDRTPPYEAGDIAVLVNMEPGPGCGGRLIYRIGHVYRGRHVPKGLCVFALRPAGTDDALTVNAIIEVKVSK